MPMFKLKDEQCQWLIQQFEKAERPTGDSTVWLRRQYCAQYVYMEEMKGVRTMLQSAYPDHCIAFDVLFETNGAEVPWHCDYESIGPFHIQDAWQASRCELFKSVHFNLTPRGGSLATLDWPLISHAVYLTIAKFGIFSTAHKWMILLLKPVLVLFGTSAPNSPGHGNVFNNIRLHGVSGGERRVSYVVRLVHRTVQITPGSLRRGVQRSEQAIAFDALSRHVSEPVEVSSIDWANVFRGEADLDRRM